MQPIYSLRNIKKKLGSFQLEVDRLDLLPGRLYTLTGPNGAGKSTLLNLLALLTPPDQGEIYFDKHLLHWNSSRFKKLRNKITLVQQHPFLFDATVLQNLAFGLKMRGVVGRKQRERIFAAMRSLGLDGFEQRRARGLSGGEAQKVAIARALVLEPEVLLLDEPTSNIDEGQIEKMEAFIPSLADAGMTVVMVSHDQGQAQRMGSDIIPLGGGRLQL